MRRSPTGAGASDPSCPPTETRHGFRTEGRLRCDEAHDGVVAGRGCGDLSRVSGAGDGLGESRARVRMADHVDSDQWGRHEDRRVAVFRAGRRRFRAPHRRGVHYLQGPVQRGVSARVFAPKTVAMTNLTATRVCTREELTALLTVLRAVDAGEREAVQVDS